MTTFGNIIWVIFGGLFLSLDYVIQACRKNVTASREKI